MNACHSAIDLIKAAMDKASALVNEKGFVVEDLGVWGEKSKGGYMSFGKPVDNIWYYLSIDWFGDCSPSHDAGDDEVLKEVANIEVGFDDEKQNGFGGQLELKSETLSLTSNVAVEKVLAGLLSEI